MIACIELLQQNLEATAYLDHPDLRKSCLLLCLVPQERAKILDLLPRFDRAGCSHGGRRLRLWLAEISQLYGGPFLFLLDSLVPAGGSDIRAYAPLFPAFLRVFHGN